MRLAVTAAVLLMTTSLFAQRGGGGGGGDAGGGGDFGGAGVRSPFDLLIEELDLDKKTQVPAVTTLLQAVERDAAALFQELVTRRQDLLNAETNQSTDPAPAAAYAATVTKLVALEAKVFGDIHAQLTPRQKQKAVKGFDRLEVMFRTVLSTSGGSRGGAGRGGPGRGAPQGGGR